MQKISFIKSLMEFQKRVLFQGNIDENKSYTMEELKELIFFNKVFINNTMEMFQRYNTSNIVDDYIECLGDYVHNIESIISHIMKKGNIIISNEDVFEKRLLIEKELSDQVITRFYKSIDQMKYKFINGAIYYISILENGYIGISFVDPRRSIYKSTMKYEFNDRTVYWKSDDCIIEYIQLLYNTIDTIAVRVTTSEKDPSIVTKVEFKGNTNVMKGIFEIFGDDVLIISNPYIYIDDIENIIETNNDVTPVIDKPEYHPVSIDDLLLSDLLIEYPNDSFDEYLLFLKSAVDNINTESIYLTLYRIGDNPAIFYILRDAVTKGIDVIVNIELFASGETINRMWLREMMNVGINVLTYASGEIKVHCKLTLVEFKRGKQIAQIGTGNYHTKTTTQYTDLSYITSNPKICDEVKKVFKLLNGEKDITFNKNLLVTKYNARNELTKLIDSEGSKGKDGCIIMKCNALDDDDIIYHLNEAANNKCIIILIIRGVCTWIPESDTVMIKSIVWDKLEHSRVYSFGKINPTIYLGSLDLVTKKIDKRIETLVKVDNPDIMNSLCGYINRYVTSNQGSWIQTSSGMYIKEE